MADLDRISPGPGAPRMRVFSGTDLSMIADFDAYASTFSGGVFVAAGDFNGDGHADIVTAPVSNGGPHVKVFSGADAALLTQICWFSSGE